MQTLFNIINIPFGWALEFLSGLFGGNFAAAVFMFTLLINVLLIPLSIKSQKSSVQQTRIKPKLDELRKKYGDDKQKYNEAMQKLYQEEGVSLSGGCLPMVLRLVLMMSIYYLIMSPLTYLVHIDSSVISEAAKQIGTTANARAELQIIEAVRNGTIDFPQIADKLGAIDFNFFGIDLTQTPKFSFDIFHDAQLIWIMPIIAFLAQMLTSAISLGGNDAYHAPAFTVYRLYTSGRRCVLLGVLFSYRRSYSGRRSAVLRSAKDAFPRKAQGAQ